MRGFEDLENFSRASKSLFCSIMVTCHRGLIQGVDCELDIDLLVESRLDVEICEWSR